MAMEMTSTYSGHFRQVRKMLEWLLATVFLIGCAASSGGHSPIIAQSAAKVPVLARILNFPSGQKNIGQVVFLVEINYTDLQFIKINGTYSAKVEYTFSLGDTQNPDADYLIDDIREISVDTFAETVEKQKVMRITEHLNVPVGEYKAQIVVADKNANGRGYIEHALTVRDLASEFTLTEPFLAWDSLSTFQPEKLIPLRTSDFERDFYAGVLVGGVDTTQTLALAYKLIDTKDSILFERSVLVRPGKHSILFSLPIPSDKLSLGFTKLQILCRQGEQTIASNLRIRSNFGYRPGKVRNFQKLIGPMRLIMSKKEHDELVNASPERQIELFNAFWKRRNPEASSDGSNQLLEEFYRRVEVANVRFSWAGSEGYRTDRGRIYILYGPPDSMQNTQRVGATTNYEIWTYIDLGRRFVFIDKYNDGHYQLLSDNGP